jgi:hypothetical protein
MTTAWNEGATFYPVADEAALRHLHETFYGAQNTYDEKGSFMGTTEKPYPFYADASKERMTRSCTLPVKNHMATRFQLYMSWEDCNQESILKSPAIGFTNLRFALPGSLKPEEVFKYMDLEVGNMRWERLRPEAPGLCESDGSLKFWHVQQGRALPPFHYHDVSILCWYLDSVPQDTEITLLYDIVPLENGPTEKNSESFVQEFPTIQTQYMGPEEGLTLKDGLYSVRCNFNHPLLNLQLRTERPIKAARLVLNRGWELPFTEAGGKEGSGGWEIVFCPFGGADGEVIGDLGLALNASRVDHMQIQIQTDDPAGPGKVVHWAQNYQVARVMSGMAGLVWSK